jgi:hypothetical protein
VPQLTVTKAVPEPPVTLAPVGADQLYELAFDTPVIVYETDEPEHTIPLPVIAPPEGKTFTVSVAAVELTEHPAGFETTHA